MEEKLKILLIDDDISFLKIYSRIIRDQGYTVFSVSDGLQAFDMMEASPAEIVICDIALPKMNGIEVLARIRQKYPDTQVLMLTGEGSISGAVESMEKGAYTYMIKPVEISELLHNIKRAEDFIRLNSENMTLKNRLAVLKNQKKLVGTSDAICQIKDIIAKVAPSNASVLITGESGTGKEIIANLIHENSSRSNGPMIKVNCSALAENLLESELFGYVKGAYTGAESEKKGRFEMAKGGTIFLDEIGDMSAPLQSKILRVIQEKEFEKVGSAQTIAADFRLICATNKDLKEEIKAGRFREDLYFRINVVPIKTTPLRQRKEDILPTMEYYLNHYCREMNRSAIHLSSDAKKSLEGYQWPGNVRELKNMAERLVVLGNGTIVEQYMLPEEVQNSETDCYYSDYRKSKIEFERRYLTKMLEQNNWNISLTAEKIGIARKNLQAKIKQLDLQKKE